MSGVTLYDSNVNELDPTAIGALSGLIISVTATTLIYLSQIAPYVEESLGGLVGIGIVSTGAVLGGAGGASLGNIYNSMKRKTK